MKKCFMMFVFLVLMLLLASLSDNTNATISEDNVVMENATNEMMVSNTDPDDLKR